MNKFVSISIGFAGLIHLVLAPQHFEHAPAHGMFFVIVGIIEVIWAILFWKRPSQWLYWSGVAIAGGLLVLWIITRFWLAPFEHETGGLDIGGIACKLSELAGVIALSAMAIKGSLPDMKPTTPLRLVSLAIALSIASGLLLYSAGHAMEPLLPSLAAAEHQSKEESHTAQETNEHPGEIAGHEEKTSEGKAEIGSLHLMNAHSRPAVAGNNGVVYLTISNQGSEPDRLISIQTGVARVVEMHETVIEADIAKMRPVSEGVIIPGKSQVAFEPGGLHIMLVDLIRDLKIGDTITLTLNFENAGSVEIQVPVREP